MNRNWSLRQLFAKTCDRAPEQDTANEKTSLTGRIRFGDFKINLDERSVAARSGLAADFRRIRCPRVPG
jgi:hypothetical protein